MSTSALNKPRRWTVRPCFLMSRSVMAVPACGLAHPKEDLAICTPPLVSLRTFLAVSPDLNFDKVAHLLYEATHSTQKGWCLHLLFCVTAKPFWHIGKTWSNDNSFLLMAPTMETWPRLGKITTCFLLYMAYFFQRCDYWWKLVNLLGAIWQSKNRSPFGSPPSGTEDHKVTWIFRDDGKDLL